MELREAWGRFDYEIITYESDRIKDLDEPFILVHPPWKSIPRYLWTLSKTVVKLMFDKPDVVISCGMGWVDMVVFPLCKLLGSYTIYIESGANVHFITGTGNFVRRFADRFIVRWKDLADEIGAEYRGGIF